MLIITGKNLTSPINIVSIGYKTAASIEPTDTIFVNAIIITAKIKHIKPIFQFKVIKTPSAVATPFPPLNSKNIGNVCPSIAKNPAIYSNNVSSTSVQIRPASIATTIAITPFSTSHTNVNAAAFFPTVLKTFVEPAFLLPFSLTSNPANFLLKITENLILHKKYATIATPIYTPIIFIPPFLLFLL